jgi:hypothetical protein
MIESYKIMMLRKLNRIVFWGVGLNNNFTFFIVPSRSSTHLSQQLKRFFGCSEIR